MSTLGLSLIQRVSWKHRDCWCHAVLLIFEESAPSLHESQSRGRMNPQSVAVSTLPSFFLSSQGGAIEGSRSDPHVRGVVEAAFPGSPDCRTSGLFQNRLLFPYLCWVSGLGLISRKISWNFIFFCHGGMEEEPSNIATKLLRVTVWSSFLSACQMWLFFLSGPQVLYWRDEGLTIGQGWHPHPQDTWTDHFSVIKSAEPLDWGWRRKCQVCSSKSEELPIKRTFAEVPHWPRYSAILKALSSKRMLANSFPFILVSVLKE